VRLVVLICLSLMLLAGGCRKAEVDEKHLGPGERMFKTRCRNCHSLPKRNAKSEERWRPFLERHARRAHLNDAHIDTLMQFLGNDSIK